MGTNYYLLTKEIKYKDKLGMNYELTDTPYFAYRLHIMKNSVGWLCLFEAHEDLIESVGDIKKLCDTGDFEIFDEYNQKFTWDEFAKVFNDKYSRYKNGNAENLLSHINSNEDIRYLTFQMRYFADDEGYEFTDREFC